LPFVAIHRKAGVDSIFLAKSLIWPVVAIASGRALAAAEQPEPVEQHDHRVG
jgi:hypothetical protein